MTSEYLERPVMSLAERRDEKLGAIASMEAKLAHPDLSHVMRNFLESNIARLRAQLNNLTKE